MNMSGMKQRTIKKVLESKIKQWLNTIEDEEVRKAAEKDTIVTGGSIASMLLGEPINDFDVYFATKETTVKVADYYCKKFIELNGNINDDKQCNPHVREFNEVNCKGEEEERVGIFIRSSGVAGEIDTSEYAGISENGSTVESLNEEYQYFEIDDVDGAAAERFIDQNLSSVGKETTDDKPSYRPVFMSTNAITLSDKMQLVIRFFGNPEEIHRNYDFAHAMNWYRYYDNHLELKAEAMMCLLSKTLVYRGSLYPICSLIRTRKFINRGWKISAGELLKIAFQISELDLNDINVLRNQISGIDGAYYHELLNVLKSYHTENKLLEENGGKPEKDINSTYVATLIDRIYNT